MFPLTCSYCKHILVQKLRLKFRVHWNYSLCNQMSVPVFFQCSKIISSTYILCVFGSLTSFQILVRDFRAPLLQLVISEADLSLLLPSSNFSCPSQGYFLICKLYMKEKWSPPTNSLILNKTESYTSEQPSKQYKIKFGHIWTLCFLEVNGLSFLFHQEI